MSSVEIELKLSVQPDAIPAVRQQLFQFPHDYTSPQHLTNIYFETPDNQLRRWDMGLRIRGCNGHYEMTIKTAGKVMGGLHQRPEFNVPLPQPELDLARFPNAIWPENTDLVQLQTQLTALFSTDFNREKWLITYGESEIEVVLDQGTIFSGNKKSGDQAAPICEFELELKQGNVIDILSLANHLSSQNGLRLANKSKAARGYALVYGVSHDALPKIPEELDWQQPLSVLLPEILAQWQEQEEGWLAGLPEGKTGLAQVFQWIITLIEKQAERLPVLDLLADLLPELKAALSMSGSGTENVSYETLFYEKLSYSASWLQCKLALMQWLLVQSR
ncbi:inorganic triphosphatase [Xenorhabdus sp. DI]|uniref:CYTH domain-containing protein n=1 Tax=Xenorhabdus doucetiae TaxID=351671 RepID=UPI0019838069|nr:MULTISPECIES: CYTH domain-containing protein [unclassified Xenorhabdus]MBD2783968.1 inorganic triphosphatase [Xenorhabdus sp. 3]MBD2788476.1 inorganic triphosphatase [Xenorhabdus sp. DI]